MKTAIAVRVSSLVSAVGAVALAATPASPDEKVRTAFFENAPMDVEESMRKVLVDECELAREEPVKTESGEPIDATWLCGKNPLRFLREVLVDGTRIDDGYICAAKGLEDVVYFPLDLIEQHACVWVSFDGGSKGHDLDLEVQLRAGKE
jgi:hypothetical protein